MLRAVSVRRRLFALVFALAVHAALVVGLILGREPDPVIADAPAFEVALVTPRLPRPDVPPPAPPQPTKAGPPSGLPSRQAQPAAPPPGALDTDALFRVPFVRWPPPSWARRRNCLAGRLSDAERVYCDELLAKRGDLPFALAGDPEKQTDYERAVARKAAMRKYRAGGPFPGLRCSLGSDCPPEE